LLSIVVSPTSADPITVTGGYIQIGTEATDFTISTTGPGFVGERETGALAPIMLSGFPGATLNLSSTFVNDLTDASLLLPDRQDFAARVAFSFRAGDITVPSVDAALVSGALVSSPFTFTGAIFGYSSLDAMVNGDTPVFTYDLIGSGTARSRFFVQTTNVGEPLVHDPLAAFSVVYDFTPVPEPGTWALMGSGLALMLRRIRRTSRDR